MGASIRAISARAISARAVSARTVWAQTGSGAGGSGGAYYSAKAGAQHNQIAITSSSPAAPQPGRVECAPGPGRVAVAVYRRSAKIVKRRRRAGAGRQPGVRQPGVRAAECVAAGAASRFRAGAGMTKRRRRKVNQRRQKAIRRPRTDQIAEILCYGAEPRAIAYGFFSGRLADIPDSRSRSAAAFVAELRIQSWLSAKIRPISSESLHMR